MKIVKLFADSFEKVVKVIETSPEHAVIMVERAYIERLQTDPRFDGSISPRHYRLIIRGVVSERLIEVALHIKKISPTHTELHLVGNRDFLNAYPDSTYKH